MKDKLQALIAEQKALTAKIEKMINAIEYCEFNPEVLSTTEESSTLDPKKVYIKGHPTRGAEVRQMLLDYGGKIRTKWDWGETKGDGIFYIGDELCIQWASNNTTPKASEIKLTHTELHLPEEVSEVDLPTEEVEQLKLMTASDAILGGIYTVLTNNYRYIFIHNGFVSNDSFKPLCVMRFDEEMEFLIIGGSLNANYPIIESSKAEKDYILKAIEYNGKHFDKDNMRLLDVEEWSCKQGMPIIVRNETTNWRADIFHSYDAGDAKYPYCCNSSDECDRLYRYAMPYTEENLKIIGTTDSPDKHYKFVEK